MSEEKDLTIRVAQSPSRELSLCKGESTFTIGKGTAASTERWYLYTPVSSCYGDSLQEVLDEARKDYPTIDFWLSEFTSR